MKYRYNFDDWEDDPPHYIDGFDPEDWKEMAIAMIKKNIELLPDSILGHFAKGIILNDEKETGSAIYGRCARAVIRKNEYRLPFRHVFAQFARALIREDSTCIKADDRVKKIADAIITGNKFLLDDINPDLFKPL